MRRFIILSVLGLGLCLGSSATTQAAVVKRITTTKTTVEKQVTIEHVGAVHRDAAHRGPVIVGPARYAHFANVHWDFHHFRG